MQPSSSLCPAATCETVVYIVYHHTCLVAPLTEMAYTVHAVDVDNIVPGDPLPDPVLTLREDEFPFSMGVGRLGSSIYFIGGEIPGKPGKPSLEVYIFDTECLDSTRHPIEDPHSFLKKGPTLNGPKSLPYVFTVGGKLCVMARSFCPDDKANPEPRIEILDPDLGEWAILPEPEFDHSTCWRDKYCIKAFDVVDSCIILWMGYGVVYQLDVCLPIIQWTKIQRENPMEEFRTSLGPRSGPGSEVIDGICYPSFLFPNYENKPIGYLPSFDIALLVGGAEKHKNADIYRHIKDIMCHPSSEVIGQINYGGERRVLDCGGGKAVIFSVGYRKYFSQVSDGYGELVYTLDVVWLPKRGKRKGYDRAFNPDSKFDLWKPLVYNLGRAHGWGDFCACFAINRRRRSENLSETVTRGRRRKI